MQRQYCCLNRKVDLLKAGVIYRIHENRIFIPEADGFGIHLLDFSGKTLGFPERKDYKQVPFDAEAEKEYRFIIRTCPLPLELDGKMDNSNNW